MPKLYGFDYHLVVPSVYAFGSSALVVVVLGSIRPIDEIDQVLLFGLVGAVLLALAEGSTMVAVWWERRKWELVDGPSFRREIRAEYRRLYPGRR